MFLPTIKSCSDHHKNTLIYKHVWAVIESETLHIYEIRNNGPLNLGNDLQQKKTRETLKVTNILSLGPYISLDYSISNHFKETIT